MAEYLHATYMNAECQMHDDAYGMMDRIDTGLMTHNLIEKEREVMADYVEELKDAPISGMKKASRLVRGHR